ncbi:MAG: nuclear transport factor 2 family protein [Phycisphaerales bacterium]|nr:nuclear transport factor 2 family protein [Phycisphaerales bacterium]
MSTPLHRPTPESAAVFAARWYSAWNARDLDAIMACYDANIEHSSPFIKRYNGTDDLSIVGIDAVRDYFRRALERNPTLRFDPLHIAVGLQSIILVYRRMTGDLAAEVFELNEAGLIVRSNSHYG